MTDTAPSSPEYRRRDRRVWSAERRAAAIASRRAKLDDDMARAILRLVAASASGAARATYRQIGARYGASGVMVWKIANGKSFKHLARG